MSSSRLVVEAAEQVDQRIDGRQQQATFSGSRTPGTLLDHVADGDDLLMREDGVQDDVLGQLAHGPRSW
ncbi:MAG: hypothetical protein U0840_10740 [Gemmataceae bacterium]